MADYLSEALELLPYTRDLRRDFHRHPELGFQEVRTAAIVAQALSDLGLEVSRGVGQTGVVALLEGSRPGKVVLLRFDMDALPITEESGAEYASETPGVMHACGHDGHTAIGLTVARLLQAHAGELAGAVKFVFQPAEEGLGGAEAMIADGVLQNPRPDYVLALHLWNEKPLGWLGISPGPVMAAAEIIKVRIIGKGGHGALPHLAIDPLLAAAHIITAAQGVVARNVSPLQAAVLSITRLHTGEAFNVIPSEAQMEGTMRTFEPEVRQRVIERFHQVVTDIARAMECRAEVEVTAITPAVVNDPQVTRGVQQAAMSLWPGLTLDSAYRSMVSEDMAFMLQEVPGCYFLVGSANAAEGLNYPHHHPRFDFDERALAYAVALMAEAATRMLAGEA